MVHRDESASGGQTVHVVNRAESVCQYHRVFLSQSYREADEHQTEAERARGVFHEPDGNISTRCAAVPFGAIVTMCNKGYDSATRS